jgi:hypothetical protein
LYIADQPALFLPLRDVGQAASVLGPREAALVGAAPSQVEWEIDPFMTLAAAQTSAVAAHYTVPELTKTALEGVQKRSRKGTVTNVLAACSSAALAFAGQNWSPGHSAKETLEWVSSMLGAGQDTAGCLRRVAEYDELRTSETGLPRAFPRLNAQALAVGAEDVKVAQEGVELLGHVVKALHL